MIYFLVRKSNNRIVYCSCDYLDIKFVKFFKSIFYKDIEVLTFTNSALGECLLKSYSEIINKEF